MPEFSIIIPTYNRADFIEKTIRSILNQVYENFEIIIVDDGSTDNTKAVVDSIKDPRLHYYYKENAERGAARNYGANLASGSYINYFDSDDIAHPNHLSVAHELIKNNENVILFHLGYNIKAPSGEISRIPTPITDINKQLIDGNIFSCNGVFLQKDIALENPFNEDRYLAASEDYLLWLQLAAKYKIEHNNTITSTIIDHDARSVVKVNKEGLAQRKELMLKYLFEDKVTRDYYHQHRSTITSNAYSYIALHYVLATNVQNKHALPYLLKSIIANPKSLFQRRTFAIIKRLIFGN